MTLHELIGELQQLERDGHGNATVMIAYQPSWPLQCSLGEVKIHGTKSEDIDECESFIFNAKNDYPDDVATARVQLEQLKDENEFIVYLCEGGNGAYAPGGIFE